MSALSTWPSTLTSHKASNYFPEPTDWSSFRGVKIHYQNPSSVLRSRVNSLLNIEQKKLYFRCRNRSSHLNLTVWSMVVLPFFVTLLRSFSELAFFNLSSHVFVSILPKTDMFAYMIRLVINYLWSRWYFTSSGSISILPKTDLSKSSVRNDLRRTGAE